MKQQEIDQQIQRVNEHIAAAWKRYAETSNDKEIDRVIALEAILAALHASAENAFWSLQAVGNASHPKKDVSTIPDVPSKYFN